MMRRTIKKIRYWKFNNNNCQPFLNAKIRSITITWAIKIKSSLLNFESCLEIMALTICHNKKSKMIIPENNKTVGKSKFHRKLIWSLPSKTRSTIEDPDSTFAIKGADDHLEKRKNKNVKASPIE